MTGAEEESLLTFSISWSRARFEPLAPPAGMDDVRSSLPLPEPSSESWPRRVLPIGLDTDFWAF